MPNFYATLNLALHSMRAPDNSITNTSDVHVSALTVLFDGLRKNYEDEGSLCTYVTTLTHTVQPDALLEVNCPSPTAT